VEHKGWVAMRVRDERKEERATRNETEEQQQVKMRHREGKERRGRNSQWEMSVQEGSIMYGIKRAARDR
jgi:hypothetical protein